MCLDIGHCAAYGQDALLSSPTDRWHGNAWACSISAGWTTKAGIWLWTTRTGLVPLDAVRLALAAAPPTARVMLEVFHWAGVAASAAQVAALADREEKA